MLAEVQRNGSVYQETIVYDIARKFGSQFTVDNASGNLSIRKDVLAAFRSISEETVVWERGERLWRKRESHDDGRRQQE